MGIVFSTGTELITHALEKLGVYGTSDAPSAEDIDFGLRSMNVLLDKFGIERGSIYIRTEDSKVLTVGIGAYTIGQVAADWDTVRPIKIEQAFLRDSNSVDTILDCEMSEEEYNEIPDKTFQTQPSRIFYKQTYPNGTIYFNYLLDEADTLHIRSWKPFTKFTDPGDALAFPDGYESMFVYNLAVEMAEAFKKEVSAKLAYDAELTLNNVKNLNLEVPDFKFDVPTTPASRTGNIYNLGF